MRRCVWILLPLLIVPAARASENRLYVADQSDFGAKRGFYVDFENSSGDGSPCKLESLRLILGVADGNQWQFAVTAPKFSMGEVLKVHATISGGKGLLSLNDAPIGEISGGFSPAEKPLSAGDEPSWAAAPAEYRLVEHSVRVSSGDRAVQNTFLGAASTGRLLLFETPLPWSKDLPLKPDDTVTIDAVITVEKSAPDSEATGPFIDRFGQAMEAKFPGKVVVDSDIAKSGADEKPILDRWLGDRKFDKYGGVMGSPWTEAPTGFYRIAKHEGMWWLITPLGSPCFYTGMCTAPDATWDSSPATGRESIWQELPTKTGPFSAAWTSNPWGSDPGTEYIGFNTVNLIRKFGDDWKSKTPSELETRLAAWGFSGLGKWADGALNLPSVPVLHYTVAKAGRHPDVFDPAVCDKIRDSLTAEIGERKSDPNVVGWSIGNEYDEIITPEEVGAALKLPDGSPLKKALLDHLLNTTYKGDSAAMAKAWAPGAPGADMEGMRRFYAGAYYSFLYKTVKAIDPNHLYLGFWIVPNWWVNDTDWSLIAPYCDVIGYDRYSESFSGIETLLSRFDKPVILGEFSFPAWYGGQRGFGRYSVFAETERESGEKYAALIHAASQSPCCIGAMWFQYRDEPLTGRGPGSGGALVIGEHFAFGFVNVTDRPRMDLVTLAREANLAAANDRLKAGH